MTIKKGIRLGETDLLGGDLRTAKALSLDTVDEFMDFVQLFPREAASLFDRTDITAASARAAGWGAGSVSAISTVELEGMVATQGLGALAPAAELTEQTADLYLDDVDIDPPAASEDTPAVQLTCMGPVRDQGPRSTCVAHTVCAMLECVLGGEGAVLDLSEQYLYWLCKINDGAPNGRGTWQRVAVPLALQYGVCEEAAWPYNPLQTGSEGQGPPPPGVPGLPPPHRATSGEMVDPVWIEGICGRLDAGRPVGISVPVYPNRRIAQLSGDIPMPLPGSVPDGGHAMCVVGYGFDDGYLGGGYVIVRNSWGTGWASQSAFGAGYGTLPFAYLRQFGWEAFSVLPPKR